MQRTAYITLLGDQEIAREGLKRLLEDGGFRASCAPLESLTQLIEELVDEPDHIVLIDTQSSELAIQATATLRPRLQHARIVLLEVGCDPATVQAALANGVDGYLARQVSCMPLLLMLDLVALGEKVLPRKFVDEFAIRPFGTPSPGLEAINIRHGLSDRELSILRCLVDGDPNKIIARRLGITEATVKIHVKGILRKLHVLNRTQAAIWVVNQRLFEPAQHSA